MLNGVAQSRRSLTSQPRSCSHEQRGPSSLFTVRDLEGDSITSYDLYNATGSGPLSVAVQAAGTIIPVTVAQLAQTSCVAGSVNDQLYAQASDGTTWSAWTPFTAGPAPTVNRF